VYHLSDDAHMAGGGLLIVPGSSPDYNEVEHLTRREQILGICNAVCEASLDMATKEIQLGPMFGLTPW
jgi:hypothetical protein